ncbi:MAG: adenylate/guanylate cyclase domain-containing protein [Treponema sp.]|jgi:class 3 adenylate cyclase|nr:adenylate/guanylate cyclase domain-containing protein [Treponema sp.]
MTNFGALENLLKERNEYPERLAETDKKIWDAFGKTCAVWVLDMSGFSRLTMKYGITHFLAMIHRLQDIVLPIIHAEGGKIVKTEADNIFATFNDVSSAVTTSRKILTELDKANKFLPHDWDLYVSIGIGYGDILMVGDNDFYGCEVNYASKLGEDVAKPGEIYLTENAYSRLNGAVDSEPHEIHISGTKIMSYLLS